MTRWFGIMFDCIQRKDVGRVGSCRRVHPRTPIRIAPFLKRRTTTRSRSDSEPSGLLCRDSSRVHHPPHCAKIHCCSGCVQIFVLLEENGLWVFDRNSYVGESTIVVGVPTHNVGVCSRAAAAVGPETKPDGYKASRATGRHRL